MALVKGQLFTLKVNPDFKNELLKFGSPNVAVCFNCGNCTAVCSIASESVSIPRKLIRYAQLGLEKRILMSPDAWLCYFCGECSETCPRQAEPGEMIMAIRRYITSKFSTPLARALYKSRLAASIFITTTLIVPFLLILLHTLLYSKVSLTAVKLFDFVPVVAIEAVGIVLGVIVVLIALVGFVRLGLSIHQGMVASSESKQGVRRWLKEFFLTLFYEVIAQLRFFKCRKLGQARGRHLALHTIPHLAMVLGFIGLFIVTTIRFTLIPTHGEIVPLTEPVRLGGIVSGVLLVYGSAMVLANRIMKVDKCDAFSTYTDIAFPLLLFLSGITGFLLTFFHYIGAAFWSYVLFTLHLIVVFELIILAPFTKFIHSLYRPVALWVARVYGRV